MDASYFILSMQCFSEHLQRTCVPSMTIMAMKMTVNSLTTATTAVKSWCRIRFIEPVLRSAGAQSGQLALHGSSPGKRKITGQIRAGGLPAPHP